MGKTNTPEAKGPDVPPDQGAPPPPAPPEEKRPPVPTGHVRLLAPDDACSLEIDGHSIDVLDGRVIVPMRLADGLVKHQGFILAPEA